MPKEMSAGAGGSICKLSKETQSDVITISEPMSSGIWIWAFNSALNPFLNGKTKAPKPPRIYFIGSGSSNCTAGYALMFRHRGSDHRSVEFVNQATDVASSHSVCAP